ncbi:PaaI family thioesterase [Actinomycetospora aeridis]|uniref:Thioesterase superfamily protein n=1 Tax=Actinomycetospora aeridis TaxID=3129231 RepID=A0ABU8NDA2_9PSEU
MHAAVGARLRAIEPGRAEATMPAADPDGLDAALWVLADFVSGLAVTGTLGSGERITTLRLTLHVIARDGVTGTLHGTGWLDEKSEVGLSTAVITDDDGRTVARAVGRNAILADEVAASTWPGHAPAWSDPPRRAADLLADGAAPDPASVNHAGVVQGGMLASLPARALADLLGGPADEATATFLRAVPAGPSDGRTLHTAPELEHGGRRLRSGRVVLRHGDDRTVLTVTGLRYAP